MCQVKYTTFLSNNSADCLQVYLKNQLFVRIEFLERFDPVCQGGQSILCGGRISFRCSLAVDLIDVLEKAEDKCVSAF